MTEKQDNTKETMDVPAITEAETSSENLKPKSLLGFRHVQSVLLFFSLFIAFGMRVNMSIGIVAMTDRDNEGTFDWSMQTQSVILSSFFWGYVFLQIPGGELAGRFGSKILLTICIGVNSAVTLLMPLCAYYGGWQLVCAGRVIQGLAQGFLYPCMHNLIGKWVPLEEKSRLGTFIYAGAHLGNAAQFASAGFISEYWGWPAIFYVIGSIGSVWTVLYVFFGAASPESTTLISHEEKLYIQTSLGHVGGHKKMRTPWKSIFTSLPFISLIIVHCGQNWGFWTLMTEIPSYMKQVLDVDIKSNGLLSALPYLSLYILSFPFGFMSDYVIAKKWLSITVARKISNSIGLYGAAIALIGLSYTPADVTTAVAILTVIVCINGGHITGFLLVHIDMAPNFAGTMMGITNSCANIISIIAPLAAGAILDDETDPKEWRKVFYVASAIYIATNTVFLFFGTSEKQAWNEQDEIDDTKTEKGEKVPT